MDRNRDRPTEKHHLDLTRLLETVRRVYQVVLIVQLVIWVIIVVIRIMKTLHGLIW